jgi:hypothetical protein
MNKYIIYDTTGNIVSCGESESIIDQRISLDHIQLWIDFPDDVENYKIINGSLVRVSDAEIDEREAEQAWALFRDLRDSRLAASDWTQVADAPVDQAAWATYRQQLRDLPENTEDPANPTWPSIPT